MGHILSPEQKLVVDALCKQSASDIKYFDLQTAFQTIEAALVEALEQQKKVLLQLPKDTDQRNAFLSLLSKSKLSQVTIKSDEISPIPEKDVIKMRTLLKEQVDTDIIIQHTLAGEKQELLNAEITRYYDQLDRKVMNDISLKDFVTSLIYKYRMQIAPISLPPNSSFDFTSTEYASIKKDLKMAKDIYEHQFDLFDHLNLVNDEVWTMDEKEIETKKILVQEFVQEISEIENLFQQTEQILTVNATAQSQGNIHELTRLIDEQSVICLKHHISSSYMVEEKKGFSLFGKRKNTNPNQAYITAYKEICEQIKQVSTQWHSQLDSVDTFEINYEFVTHFIRTVRALTPAYAKEKAKEQSNSILRINKINTSSPEVIQLDKRMKNLVDRINSESLFIKKIRHNALSFNKQKETCQEVKTYLDKCSILIGEGSAYSLWKAFWNRTNEGFKKAFALIKSKPKSAWIQTYDQWYFGMMTQQLSSFQNIESQLSSAYKNQVKTNKLSIDTIINKNIPTRINAVRKLKSESKELYNTLFKKKMLPSTSWNNIALMGRPFMQAFFPIHIQDKLSATSDYDVLISLNRRPEILNNDSEVHHISPIQGVDIENRQGSNDLFLYLNTYTYEKPLVQLTNSEKLNAAKKLAKYILSLSQQVKIYQIKTANIISILPPYDDAYLEKRLDRHGMKAIDTDGNLYDRITESILFTERTPYLIMKDELINPDQHTHSLWQKDVTVTFQNAGYRVISVDTAEQMKNNKAYFDAIILQLTNGEIMTKSTSKTQFKQTNPTTKTV